MSDAPTARDVKVFVPANDFATSRRFYAALGWHENWHHESGLAEIELAGRRMFLQDFYAKDWAENFMLYVNVDDADAWYEHAKAVVEAFEGTRVAEPKDEPHGDRVTYVWDPSGVLLHFAQGLG